MKKCYCEDRRRVSDLPSFVDQLNEGETCILLDGVLPLLNAKKLNFKYDRGKCVRKTVAASVYRHSHLTTNVPYTFIRHDNNE